MRRKLAILVLMTLAVLMSASEVAIFTIDEQVLLDDLIAESVEYFFDNFTSIPPEKFTGEEGRAIEGLVIYFESDVEGKIYRQMREVFTKRAGMRIYEKERVSDLLREQGIQKQDYYSHADKLRIAQLTQWKGILIGKVQPQREVNLGKPRVYLDIGVDIINLETGETIMSDNYKDNRRVSFSLKYFLAGIFLVILGIIGLNAITRGRKTSVIVGSGVIILALYSVWFYVI